MSAAFGVITPFREGLEGTFDCRLTKAAVWIDCDVANIAQARRRGDRGAVAGIVAQRREWRHAFYRAAFDVQARETLVCDDDQIFIGHQPQMPRRTVERAWILVQEPPVGAEDIAAVFAIVRPRAAGAVQGHVPRAVTELPGVAPAPPILRTCVTRFFATGSDPEPPPVFCKNCAEYERQANDQPAWCGSKWRFLHEALRDHVMLTSFGAVKYWLSHPRQVAITWPSGLLESVSVAPLPLRNNLGITFTLLRSNQGQDYTAQACWGGA